MPDLSSPASSRRLLPILGAIAALLAIASAKWALDKAWLNFAFKPLATLSVIAWAATGRSDDAPVRRWTVIGLVFSLAGDVALLWPVQGFLVGLVAFLLGHLSYLVALTRRVKFLASPPAFGAWAIVAASVLASLWAGVPPELRAPVLVYVCALAAMAAQATSVWLARRRDRRRAVRAVRRDPGHRQVRRRHPAAHAVEPVHLLGRAMVNRPRGRRFPP